MSSTLLLHVIGKLVDTVAFKVGGSSPVHITLDPEIVIEGFGFTTTLWVSNIGPLKDKS